MLTCHLTCIFIFGFSVEGPSGLLYSTIWKTDSLRKFCLILFCLFGDFVALEVEPKDFHWSLLFYFIFGDVVLLIYFII